jgi:peptide/nickel transport system permease protein
MKMKDLKFWLKDFWNEYKKVKFGIVGFVFLIIFLLLMIFEPYIVPFSQASSRWRDITYWDDNPSGAPPVWTNWFSSKKSPESEKITKYQSEVIEGDLKFINSTFEYDYKYDKAPLDIIFHGKGTGNMIMIVKMERPDGETFDLVQMHIQTDGGNDIRITLDKDSGAAAFDFAQKFESEENLQYVDKTSVKPLDIYFAQAKSDMLNKIEPLKGIYKFTVTAILLDQESSYEDPFMVVSGRVSGILGTDNSKRDIWSGVVAGVKWALLIGLLTAVIAVGIGVVYGVISAFYGGFVDSIMQRIFELFASTPLLPVLIVMSAVFKPSIWTMILMMCAFFWTGPVKTVRSMALQIKEETYIEASKAVGASNARLIFKHMVPILVPYSFASMALYVPSAIVYEATISLIGLGDATIVTWGQILHDALKGGAVLTGLWWWVVPPGIMIALMGMTFAFIGFAMDKILQPKLRTR